VSVDPAHIEKLRAQSEANPNDEIAHFSLGRILLESGDAAEAAKSLQRVLALNPNISKAYQLLGEAQLKTGHRDFAIQTLTEGVNVAHRRGDLMPKNEMSDKLRELGAAVPEFADPRAIAVGEGEVFCKRHGGTGPKLPKPPFRNAFGQEIFENTCAKCWREAIGFGTKVINELRLPLNDPAAQRMWDQHIRDFLNLNK
jgi:Fe-S cluster biosynthesis and repair protein YggX